MSGQAQVLELLVIRSLLERADDSLREANAIGSMSTLLMGDVAIEYAVKLALRELGEPVSENTAEGVAKLVAKRPALAKLTVPVKAHRQARNRIAHHGTAPSAELVVSHARDADEFVVAVVREVFGVEIDSISTVQLVRTPMLREKLEQAENSKCSPRPVLTPS